MARTKQTARLKNTEPGDKQSGGKRRRKDTKSKRLRAIRSAQKQSARTNPLKRARVRRRVQQVLSAIAMSDTTRVMRISQRALDVIIDVCVEHIVNVLNVSFIVSRQCKRITLQPNDINCAMAIVAKTTFKHPMQIDAPKNTAPV